MDMQVHGRHQPQYHPVGLSLLCPARHVSVTFLMANDNY